MNSSGFKKEVGNLFLFFWLQNVADSLLLYVIMFFAVSNNFVLFKARACCEDSYDLSLRNIVLFVKYRRILALAGSCLRCNIDLLYNIASSKLCTYHPDDC